MIGSSPGPFNGSKNYCMIKKIFKGLGIFIGVVVVLVALFYAKVYYSTEKRKNRTYHVSIPAMNITADSASLLKGKRLTVVKGCVDCHGADLSGKIMADDIALGRLTSANLTRGKGGLPSTHTTSDWILALKHGIRKDGKPLIFMPSHEFTLLSQEDMSAIIGYVQQIPAVDNELPPIEIGPLSRVLSEVDEDFVLFPAELIDHNRMQIQSVKAEVSIEYGEYLSTSCKGCHKATMKGGESIAPGYPIVADITSTGHPGKWTEEQFITTLRTGVTPEGKVLNPEFMPWPMAKEFTDTELKALRTYLVSL
jgi:cytochrome c553